MEIEEIENWKPIRGYETFYEVSNLGRVRSLDREVQTKGLSKRLHRGRVLTPSFHHTGYVQVGLCVEGVQKNHLVHRLVLAAFSGPAADGFEGCHKDGDRSNNKLSNLRWDTPIGNAADKASNAGAANPNSKLTSAEVLEVVRLKAAKVPQNEIAARLNASVVTINHILTGRTWSSLTGIPYAKKHASVDQALADRMAEMKREGMTLGDIAAKLNVGKATVFRNYKRGALV